MGLRIHPCYLAEPQISPLSICVKPFLSLSWMLTDRDHWLFFSCSANDRKVPPDRRWLLMHVQMQLSILCGLPWLCIEVQFELFCLMQTARYSHDTQMTTSGESEFLTQKYKKKHMTFERAASSMQMQHAVSL